MAILTKIAILSTLLLTIAIFIFYSNIITNEIYKSYFIKTINKVETFETFENSKQIIRVINDSRIWTINYLIAQYSPALVKNANNILSVEALVFYNHEDQSEQNLKSNVKFIVQSGNETLLLKVKKARRTYTSIKAADGNSSNRFVWKLWGEFEADSFSFFELERVVFLIADLVEYYRMLNKSSYNEEAVSGLLVFQKPVLFDSRARKKAAFAHCVHTVRDLTNNNKIGKMKTWLKIQKLLGIDRVKLYFFQVEKKEENEIRTWNSSDIPFIEIIDIRLVCLIIFRFMNFSFSVGNGIGNR